MLQILAQDAVETKPSQSSGRFHVVIQTAHPRLVPNPVTGFLGSISVSRFISRNGFDTAEEADAAVSILRRTRRIDPKHWSYRAPSRPDTNQADGFGPPSAEQESFMRQYGGMPD